MAISGLGSGGVRTKKAMAQPARTFMPGSMEAQQHLGKCAELTAANSLDIAQERGRLDPWCQSGRKRSPAGQSPKGIAALAQPQTEAVWQG